MYFGIVAIAEESSKYIFLRHRTWNNPEFNCTYDGVIYAVFTSLGFALWENIRGFVKKPTIVILYMEDQNGYILNNKVLGNTRKDLIRLLIHGMMQLMKLKLNLKKYQKQMLIIQYS